MPDAGHEIRATGQEETRPVDPCVEMHHVAAAPRSRAEVDRTPGQAAVPAQGDNQVTCMGQKSLPRRLMVVKVSASKVLPVVLDPGPPPGYRLIQGLARAHQARRPPHLARQQGRTKRRRVLTQPEVGHELAVAFLKLIPNLAG